MYPSRECKEIPQHDYCNECQITFCWNQPIMEKLKKILNYSVINDSWFDPIPVLLIHDKPLCALQHLFKGIGKNQCNVENSDTQNDERFHP